jgi:hypothetical protein
LATLGDDFADVRPWPSARRRCGSCRTCGDPARFEGDVGGASVEDQSHKMANTVDRNKQLCKTYNPVNVASTRRFDEARTKGAKLLEQRPDESVTSTALRLRLYILQPLWRL